MDLHRLDHLPAWEKMLKITVFEAFQEVRGKRILDFGSGEGITADFLAEKNQVVAVEPREEMLKDRWCDNSYEQVLGGIEAVRSMEEDSFDLIICHNVLEYIDDKGNVIKELARVLRPGGTLSLIKHNRYGRVMQMAVLLDDCGKANELLDGRDSSASKFGAIRYYEDEDVTGWAPSLTLSRCLGIRTFWDLQQQQEKHGEEVWQQEMLQLEKRVSEIEEFQKIAFFHHLFLTKKEKSPEVTTERLTLRVFRGTDYDDLYEFLSQLREDEFEGYPGITYENGREHLSYRVGNSEFWAIELQDTGKVIGNIYLGNRDFDSKEVGYIVNRDFRRQGYAAEALRAVISYAFLHGTHRIYAECDPRNECSWRLLEKVGLIREAHYKKNIYFHRDKEGNPVWKDTYVYSRLNEMTEEREGSTR